MDWYWWRRRLGRDHARTWRRHDDPSPRPRVLFEGPDGAEAHSVWRLLDRHGYDTMWCPGPSARPIHECALLRTGHCSLVDDAELVVSALDQSDPICREVVRTLDRNTKDPTRLSKPVAVVSQRSTVPELAASLSACDVVPGPLTSKMLLRLVARIPREQSPEISSAAG